MAERNMDNSLIDGPEPQRAAGTHAFKRDTDNLPQERKDLVQQIIKEVVYARDVFFKDVYEQMRSDMQFAYDGADPEWVQYGGYIANIVQRHISQKTASLYAKNPKAKAVRKEKMEFEIWDEDMNSILEAMAILQSGVLDPNAMMLLQDYQRGTANKSMITRIGKTLELVYSYYQNEQNPTFKSEMKQLVRRTITTGVGYVKSGYQRVDGRSPDYTRKLYDFQRRLKTLETTLADSEAEDADQTSPQIEQIKLMIASLEAEPEMILRQGLTHNFPLSTSIIPDPKCTDLNGFKGCDWVAEEYNFSAGQIKDIWQVDVTEGGGISHVFRTETNQFFSGIMDVNGNKIRKTNDSEAIYRVWEVYNIKTGLLYYVCEGYVDFLEEPASPLLATGKFWPWEILIFNKSENDKNVFPRSDVFLMRDQQREINRQREGLRKHRIANRPKYIAPAGSLEDEDKLRLENHEDSAVIEIMNLKMGQNSADLVQPMKMAGIDPNLYDVSQSYDDLLRVIGAQESNFGGSSNATATEVSVGESSRQSASESNRDDMDMMLSALARTDGQILFAEEPVESVKEIAGIGAVWPTFSREQRSKELFLDVEAGSSGKPNQALEVANFERLAPLVMQIPGVKPDRLAKEAIRRLDDKLDINEFLDPGLPSIVAQNNLAGSPQAGGAVSGDGTPNNQQAGGQAVQGAGGPGVQQLQNQVGS